MSWLSKARSVRSSLHCGLPPSTTSNRAQLKIGQSERQSKIFSRRGTCSRCSPIDPAPFAFVHTILSALRSVFSQSNTAQNGDVPQSKEVLSPARIWPVQKEFALPNCDYGYRSLWPPGNFKTPSWVSGLQTDRQGGSLPENICTCILIPRS